ncbi:MAG: hypothetical protein J0L62_03010 [Bacteroidetes bacterium]|nr:hypothetical protein [Bacteroidota bacterium]
MRTILFIVAFSIISSGCGWLESRTRVGFKGIAKLEDGNDHSGITVAGGDKKSVQTNSSGEYKLTGDVFGDELTITYQKEGYISMFIDVELEGFSGDTTYSLESITLKKK